MKMKMLVALLVLLVPQVVIADEYSAIGCEIERDGPIYKLYPDLCNAGPDTLVGCYFIVQSTVDGIEPHLDMLFPTYELDPWDCSDKYLICVEVQDKKKCYTTDYFMEDLGLE